MLPFVNVVAISQAPSPESHPNSPLPVSTMLGPDPTIKVDGSDIYFFSLLKELTRINVCIMFHLLFSNGQISTFILTTYLATLYTRIYHSLTTDIRVISENK